MSRPTALLLLLLAAVSATASAFSLFGRRPSPPPHSCYCVSPASAPAALPCACAPGQGALTVRHIAPPAPAAHLSLPLLPQHADEHHFAVRAPQQGVPPGHPTAWPPPNEDAVFWPPRDATPEGPLMPAPQYGFHGRATGPYQHWPVGCPTPPPCPPCRPCGGGGGGCAGCAHPSVHPTPNPPTPPAPPTPTPSSSHIPPLPTPTASPVLPPPPQSPSPSPSPSTSEVPPTPTATPSSSPVPSPSPSTSALPPTPTATATATATSTPSSSPTRSPSPSPAPKLMLTWNADDDAVGYIDGVPIGSPSIAEGRAQVEFPPCAVLFLDLHNVDRSTGTVALLTTADGAPIDGVVYATNVGDNPVPDNGMRYEKIRTRSNWASLPECFQAGAASTGSACLSNPDWFDSTDIASLNTLAYEAVPELEWFRQRGAYVDGPMTGNHGDFHYTMMIINPICD